MKTNNLFALLLCTMILFAGCSKDDNEDFQNEAGDYNHDRSVGRSAGDLLGSATYSSLKIDVLYMPGFAPDATALNNLKTFLAARLNKSGGVTISTRQIAASGASSMTFEQIRSLENNDRSAFTSGSEMAVNLIYTDGAYSDAGVLGVAYRNTSLALLGGTIHNHSGGVGQVSRTKLETTVLEHEFGHILGLTDLGSGMVTPHKDASHGSHCNNDQCLMYWASETTDALGFLLTGNIPALDANCLADLKSNGGK